MSIAWLSSTELIDYAHAISQMEDRVSTIASGHTNEQVWLLEHPSLYTCGTGASAITAPYIHELPVYQSGRGGKITYHGPGQRIGYVMLDLRKRGKDVRMYVAQLQQWLQLTLKQFDIDAYQRSDRVGLWVPINNGYDEKIVALGVRVRGWITYHGFALNVLPNLDYYKNIDPCGITHHGVTSMHKLGCQATMAQVDQVLQETFYQIFD